MPGDFQLSQQLSGCQNTLPIFPSYHKLANPALTGMTLEKTNRRIKTIRSFSLSALLSLPSLSQTLNGFHTLEQGAGELKVNDAVRAATRVKASWPKTNGAALVNAGTAFLGDNTACISPAQ